MDSYIISWRFTDADGIIIDHPVRHYPLGLDMLYQDYKLTYLSKDEMQSLAEMRLVSSTVMRPIRTLAPGGGTELAFEGKSSPNMGLHHPWTILRWHHDERTGEPAHHLMMRFGAPPPAMNTFTRKPGSKCPMAIRYLLHRTNLLVGQNEDPSPHDHERCYSDFPIGIFWGLLGLRTINRWWVVRELIEENSWCRRDGRPGFDAAPYRPMNDQPAYDEDIYLSEGELSEGDESDQGYAREAEDERDDTGQGGQMIRYHRRGGSEQLSSPVSIPNNLKLEALYSIEEPVDNEDLLLDQTDEQRVDLIRHGTGFKIDILSSSVEEPYLSSEPRQHYYEEHPQKRRNKSRKKKSRRSAQLETDDDRPIVPGGGFEGLNYDRPGHHTYPRDGLGEYINEDNYSQEPDFPSMHRTSQGHQYSPHTLEPGHDAVIISNQYISGGHSGYVSGRPYGSYDRNLQTSQTYQFPPSHLQRRKYTTSEDEERMAIEERMIEEEEERRAREKRYGKRGY
ncbi:hypothetical protein ABW20_dc0101027 [Dactylellina cionopaga]|nr:hypothetical protein ABW20_dc0101027 [Dactylellina cionopaga]